MKICVDYKNICFKVCNGQLSIKSIKKYSMWTSKLNQSNLLMKKRQLQQRKIKESIVVQ